MSLVNLAHVCSHLQNASRGRLATTSIPLTNLHLRLAQQMHRAGFLASVAIASRHTPPAPSVLGTHPDSVTTHTTTVPAHITAPSAADDTAAPVWVPTTTHTTTVDEARITPATVASRRLWLGLKYWENQPVLAHMSLVSKPTRRIWAGARALTELAAGRDWGYVRGCRQVGECLFVSTDRGIMEIRECAERGVGGMLLCRMW